MSKSEKTNKKGHGTKKDTSTDAPIQVEELLTQVDELTLDLKRSRADFENYRRRMESEKSSAREFGKANAIMQLLPVIDNIERAIAYVPDDLKDNKWVQSVAALTKNLDKSLENLQLKKIEASPGTSFNPELHNAIQFDEDAEGEHEVIAEELQAGYMLGDSPLRHAMVKVTKK